MSEISLPPGKYVLLSLDDVELIHRASETSDNVYLDVSGPDREWVRDVVLQDMLCAELPNGTLRFTFHQFYPKLQYTRCVEKIANSARGHNKTVTTSLGSFNWVGSAFDGTEAASVKQATDGRKINALIFSTATACKVVSSADKKGITGIQIGKPIEAKSSARKRNAKGHFEKAADGATAK